MTLDTRSPSRRAAQPVLGGGAGWSRSRHVATAERIAQNERQACSTGWRCSYGGAGDQRHGGRHDRRERPRAPRRRPHDGVSRSRGRRARRPDPDPGRARRLRGPINLLVAVLADGTLAASGWCRTRRPGLGDKIEEQAPTGSMASPGSRCRTRTRHTGRSSATAATSTSSRGDRHAARDRQGGQEHTAVRQGKGQRALRARGVHAGTLAVGGQADADISYAKIVRDGLWNNNQALWRCSGSARCSRPHVRDQRPGHGNRDDRGAAPVQRHRITHPSLCGGGADPLFVVVIASSSPSSSC